MEDEERILAVLTANQANAIRRITKPDRAKRGCCPEDCYRLDPGSLAFKGEWLESIAHTLRKHFGVNIRISDTGLAAQIIVWSFSGTEPLENILEVLCKINGNAHYTINGKEILLERK